MGCNKINCPNCNLELEESFLEQVCPRCQNIIEAKKSCETCHICHDENPKKENIFKKLIRFLS